MLAEQQQHLTALSSRDHSQPTSRVSSSPGAVLNVNRGLIISASANGTQAAEDEPLQFSSHMREPLDVASEPMNIPAEHKTSSSYLLGLPAVKMLVGEYPTNLFFLLESQSPLPPELSPEQSQDPLPPFQVDRSVLDHLVATFFSAVHVSHPVLNQEEFTEIYERFLDKGADSSTESALCMTVFALGAVSGQPIGLCHPQTSPNAFKCGNLDDLHMTAYLAEISIRRLLNRIHNSLYPRTPNSLNTSLSSTSLMTPEEFSIGELTSITSVCEELHNQLDSWHAAIPEQFRPPLNFEEIDNDRVSILRIRYYAARHIIYRPFVLHVTTHTSSHVSSAIAEKADSSGSKSIHMDFCIVVAWGGDHTDIVIAQFWAPAPCS
ncbi:hypothetical protein FDENT_10521 [Fusarium denticulatum]|uniref:Transcription factor domain-containing protein n=1 Tax=Fusarium denticulatum TaxID=48507 RepID=A0A8H5TPB3_9HYPO|nr:hypothetical protein FDENT_10521 [Fusarium denticulatum]